MNYCAFINFQPINFILKSIGKHLQQICDIFCLLHGSTYVELNKIYFIIFRFFYKLLRIYQFSTDLKNKRKVIWQMFYMYASVLSLFRTCFDVYKRFCIRNLRKVSILFSWTTGSGHTRRRWSDTGGGQIFGGPKFSWLRITERFTQPTLLYAVVVHTRVTWFCCVVQ